MYSIKGLSKASVLAALFNAASPMLMGFLQASVNPSTMDIESAQRLIDEQGMEFDYVWGRPMKIDISGDEVSTGGYDRDNGGIGSLAVALDRLKSSGSVEAAAELRDGLVVERAARALHMANVNTTVTVRERGVTTVALGGADVGVKLSDAVRRVVGEELTARQHLDWCVERAMEYWDAGDYKNAGASFLSDVRKHSGTSWIATAPVVPMMIIMADGSMSRQKYLELLTGFNVSC